MRYIVGACVCLNAQTMLGGALNVVGACVCVSVQTMLGGSLDIDVSMSATSL